MGKDFLKDLGFLGVTARLKRLSDALSYSIRELYKIYDFDIEPSWHLVFLILKKEEQVSLTELAEALLFSQPAMTKMITRMKAKDYVDISASDTDGRMKIIMLSKKAKKELPRFEKVWGAGQNSIKEIFEENTMFMKSLEDFENQIIIKGFKQRALERLNND